MKLKIVVVDFEIPMRVKKWAIRAGIPAVILTVAAVAWAAPLHTWSTGDALNATDLNGNFANLQAQVTTPEFATRAPSGFHAHVTNAVTIPSLVDTKVLFDTVDFDLGSEYSTSSGAFTVKNAGVYSITCGFYFNSAGAEATWSVHVQKNGTEIDGIDLPSPTGASGISPRVSDTVRLSVGEAVTCSANQTSGSSVALNASLNGLPNFFSVIRLY